MRKYFILAAVIATAGVFASSGLFTMPRPAHATADSRLKIGKIESSSTYKDGDIVEILLSVKSEGIAVYDVVYSSDGLKVKGKLFAPESAANSDARMPAVVFNHGGVSGIPSPFIVRSRQLAAEGYVVFAPSYRGEDGSEGEIEVAAGEVNDALAGVALLRALPYVNAERVAMAGTSHGGIITLLAAQRDTSLSAAVCAYGVTNTYTWYKYLVDNGFDVSDDLSVKVYGAGPEDKPEAFRRRAPALDAHIFKSPILLLYGEADNIVPPSQARELAEALDANNKTYELHIMPGAAHGFLFFMDPARRNETEIAVSSHSWSIMKAFLFKHLN